MINTRTIDTITEAVKGLLLSNESEIAKAFAIKGELKISVGIKLEDSGNDAIETSISASFTTGKITAKTEFQIDETGSSEK